MIERLSAEPIQQKQGLRENLTMQSYKEKGRGVIFSVKYLVVSSEFRTFVE